MSNENVKKFMEEVQKDKELQEKIVASSKGGKKVSEEDIVAIAEESGFAFTIYELKEVAEEKKAELMAEGELDDEALEQVAGGFWGFFALSACTLLLGCGAAAFISAGLNYVGNDMNCTDY